MLTYVTWLRWYLPEFSTVNNYFPLCNTKYSSGDTLILCRYTVLLKLLLRLLLSPFELNFTVSRSREASVKAGGDWQEESSLFKASFFFNANI